MLGKQFDDPPQFVETFPLAENEQIVAGKKDSYKWCWQQ